MIIKIYIATVIVTFVSDVLCTLKTRALMNKLGYKRKKITALETLSRVMVTLIIYALPVINILLSLFDLTMSDELREEIHQRGGRYY